MEVSLYMIFKPYTKTGRTFSTDTVNFLVPRTEYNVTMLLEDTVLNFINKRNDYLIGCIYILVLDFIKNIFWVKRRKKMQTTTTWVIKMGRT